jgi:hypothetical protein
MFWFMVFSTRTSLAPRYVVLAGRVQVESPDGLLLRYAGPGEVLSLENSLVLRAVRGKLAGERGFFRDGTSKMLWISVDHGFFHGFFLSLELRTWI